MRWSLAWLRSAYAESEGQAAPAYGIVTAAGVTAPLVVGVLTGHAAETVLVALGAFYVALAAPSGPYGARARALLVAVAVVTVFTWLGGTLSGHPWLAVAAVPVVATLASLLPWMGATATLCTVLAAIRPPTSPVIFNGFLETTGGLFVSLLLLAPWITHRLRPLRLSLAEAANAVAAATDVLGTPGAGEEEWAKRRRQAYDAIAQARVTYGLYRTGGRDEQERPRRLIEALRRTMDEAVALRATLAAVAAESPPEHWTREFGVAVSSLAARLRLLASEFSEVAVGQLQRAVPAAQPLALQQRGDEVAHLRQLQQQRITRFALAHQLGMQPRPRQRTAQLVADGQQQCTLAVQHGLDVGGHLVEAHGEVADLVAMDDRHAVRELAAAKGVGPQRQRVQRLHHVADHAERCPDDPQQPDHAQQQYVGAAHGRPQQDAARAGQHDEDGRNDQRRHLAPLSSAIESSAPHG